MVRSLVFGNLGLKFVALLLAVLIFLHVYTDRPATMVVSFPVQLVDLPDSLTLSGPVPAAIQVELRGTGKQLIRLRLREPLLPISLAKVGPGRYERALTPADLPLGGEDGPQVERLIGPLMLDLRIEPRMDRRLPVAARIMGRAGEGFTWNGTLVLEPASVDVSGPESVLADLDSVRLEPVRLAGVRDTLRAVAAPSGLPEWCVVTPSEVTVTAIVEPAP